MHGHDVVQTLKAAKHGALNVILNIYELVAVTHATENLKGIYFR